MQCVREINDIAELADLRSVWHKLLAQTRGATFFSTPEWLEVYWQHFAGNQRLRVLVIAEGHETVGILPLVIRQERRRVGTIATLAYPLDYWGSFYGPVGRDRRSILTAGLSHVCRTRPDWDVIDLGFVDELAVDRGATRDALRQVGLQSHRRIRDRAPLVRLPSSYEAYLATRKPKWRENMRRCLRNSAKLEGLTFERHIPGIGRSTPRWDLYDACEEVARRSWQATSAAGTTICHESVRPFLRGVHEAASRLGAADINLLWLKDRPIAFAYNYVWRGCVFGLRMGYDAHWSRAGVGNLLLDHTVRDSIQRGFHAFDLGPGSLDAKRQVQTGVKAVVQYSHYRPGAPRAQLLRIKHLVGALVNRGSQGPFRKTALSRERAK